MAEVTKFKGTVVQRSANGSGMVEISSPPAYEHKMGIFTIDVTHTREVSKTARVGHTVEGLAVPLGEGFKILRIDPK